jgi:hypothetical protein
MRVGQKTERSSTCVYLAQIPAYRPLDREIIKVESDPNFSNEGARKSLQGQQHRRRWCYISLHTVERVLCGRI